jgi:hypothetical protein
MKEGLKYYEATLDEGFTQGKPRVIMKFFDEKGIARDLERAFTGSEIKKFRDFQKYLLKEIHRIIKVKKGI